MTRKILQIGSSVGVTIPKSILDKLGLEVGEEVEIREENGKVSLEKASGENMVDPELAEWTDEFIDTYRPALEELADK